MSSLRSSKGEEIAKKHGLLGGFNVYVFDSLEQRTIFFGIPTPHQKHGCDCDDQIFHRHLLRNA